MSKNVKLDFYEAMEIADFITKVDNPNSDEDISETALIEKWDITLETFEDIVNTIFQMIDFGMSPVTQTPYVGIAKPNEWLVKKEVNQQFVSAVINWATEGEAMTEKQKGFICTITANGKAEYNVAIYKPHLTAVIS